MNYNELFELLKEKTLLAEFVDSKNNQDYWYKLSKSERKVYNIPTIIGTFEEVYRKVNGDDIIIVKHFTEHDIFIKIVLPLDSYVSYDTYESSYGGNNYFSDNEYFDFDWKTLEKDNYLDGGAISSRVSQTFPSQTTITEFI